MACLLFQEEILFDLSGTKCPKVKDGKSLPSYMYIGHFLKPYFKDKVTGVVSSNEPSWQLVMCPGRKDSSPEPVVSTGVFPWVYIL